ncbi:uncharacterized protein LOC141627964 [Silene latifolia]|uniref:uncharacterized protein LOC141627964 n=1 Tax=Silene latifolia TaxID=37657 RepID=UPI003D78900E
MAIKLDMAKAYDRVQWAFLERVLFSLGFDRSWSGRVMACVKTVSFSVLVNGNPSREFRPARGLRQGDPLSPYLFILCSEVLSHQMRRAIEIGSIHGIRISTNAPSISHLLFADDSLFFVKATEEEADAVSDILRRYEAASGQLVSLEKTTVSFSKGVLRGRRSLIANRLGIVEVEEQHRYLGLPTVVGRSKKVLTDILRDKLSKRLQGWRGKILSRAAQLGANPSYTWRGIMEARVVLETGMRWRIGDGNSTRVWRETWLPGTHMGRVISPCVDGNENLKVSELLSKYGGWNLELVSSLFLPFETEHILNIRVSQHRPMDIWYWKAEKDGMYFVKSAYRALAGGEGVEDQVWEPHVAEAVAVLEGAKEAMRLGYRDIVIESDFAQVIEALNKKQAERSSFMLVIEEILCLSVSFSSVVWSFSSRVNNSVAHALALVYPRISGRTEWSSVLPPTANDAVLFDLSLLK